MSLITQQEQSMQKAAVASQEAERLRLQAEASNKANAGVDHVQTPGDDSDDDAVSQKSGASFHSVDLDGFGNSAQDDVSAETSADPLNPFIGVIDCGDDEMIVPGKILLVAAQNETVDKLF